MSTKWEKTQNGNYSLEGEDFYLSFRPSSRASTFNDPIASFMGEAFDGDNEGGAETALVKKTQGRPIFLVLNGDHREAFGAAFDGGFDACMEVYRNLAPEHKSKWDESDKPATA